MSPRINWSKAMPNGLGDRPGQRQYVITCAECGQSHTAFVYECERCAGAVVLEPEAVNEVEPGPSSAGLWRWADLLPVTAATPTLGEGGTPLVGLHGMPGIPSDARVYAKLETQNPTLSFKDRAMALGTSVALDRGLRGLAVASTGNAAVSASAYAAAAGLRCQVLVGTASNATTKLDMCRRFGADVVEVEGDYSAAYAQACQAEHGDWLNVSTTYRNPVLAEGYRPLAFELLEEVGEAPSCVVVPVGAGPLLRGVERGFADAVSIGAASATPAMIGVQAAAVAPLATAWAGGTWTETLQRQRTWGKTVASAIADAMRGYERQGLLTLAAAERTGGLVAAVSEESLVQAQSALTGRGLWVEPSAAAPLAFLREQSPSWWAAQRGPVVLILTGHGIKT